MRKPKINEQYFTICVYVFIVAAITTLCILLGINFNKIIASISTVLGAVKCVLYGLLFSYFLNYILSLWENMIFKKIKKGLIKRLSCVILSYIVFSGIIVAFLMLIIPEIANNYAELATRGRELLNNVIALLNRYSIDITNLIDEILAADFSIYLKGFFNTGGIILTEIGNIFIGFILSFYILLKKEKLLAVANKLLKALLPKRVYDPTTALLADINSVFGKYFMGTLVASFFVGMETMLAMLLFRLPYPYLVSVIVAITNVIPYFGPFLGAIPGAIIIFAGGGIWPTITFVIIILVLQQIDGNFITPKILGTSVGLSSIWVIISITIFSAIFGIVGMIIGVPLFTVIYNVVRNATNRRLDKKGYRTDSEPYDNLFSPEASYTLMNKIGTPNTESTKSANTADTDGDPVGGGKES